MNVEGKKIIDSERTKVWELLIDPEVLRLAIPGCKSLDKVSENTYQFEIELKVAAIVGNYSGQIEIIDAHPPKKYGLKIKGTGALGHMESTVFIELIQLEDQTTEMIYSGEAEVGGKVAKVGQRVLSSVAKLVTSRFFSSFVKQVNMQST